MTLHQELRGAKKDFGVVGFHEEDNAQYLLFPKSLKRFDDRRVIGINYDLLAKTAPAQSNKVSAPERKHPPAKLKKDGAVAAKDIKGSENVVEFSPVPERTEKKTKESPAPSKKAVTVPPRPEKAEESKAPREAVEPKKNADPLPAPIVRELEKVLKELRAGKSVVAYERLEAVVNQAKAK